MGIFAALAICTAGIILNRYIPAKIFNESKTLAHTPVCLEMSMVAFVYELVCVIVLIVIAIAVCVSFINKARAIIKLVYVFIALIVGFSLMLPLGTPFYRPQFSGFIEGIKQNVDPRQLREWIDSTVSKIDAGKGESFEGGELNFLSRTGLMECEAFIDKNDDGTYILRMYWSDPVGQYGLFAATDRKAAENMFKEYEMEEIYDNIYAWTDNE